jgi:DNA-binding MarR family transcriptional regulator
MDNLDPSINAITLITLNTLIIDKCTGEILGHDSKPSALTGTIKYQGELGTCRSVDDYLDHLSFVDRRKLPPHELHSLRDEVNYAHGNWRRTGLDCRITLPQQRLLEKLHRLVLYRNVIFMTQVDLAKDLGIAESNLMKKLRVLIDANLLKVRTSRDGIRTGEIMLLINPRLVFRGPDRTKGRYTREWYRPVSSLSDGEAGSNNATGGIAIAA